MSAKQKLSQEEFEASIAWARVVAGCVIRDDKGKYLLVQEAQKRVYGLWNIPAGLVDKGESIEEAAVREAREECGLTVELLGKVGVWHEGVETPVKHAFTAKIIKGTIRPQPDEILDVKWFSYDEIVRMNQDGKIRAPWIFEAISQVEAT